MTAEIRRVARSAQLGVAGRSLDMALGVSAVAPLLGCAALLLFPALPLAIVRTLAVIWSACLLAFFAGVRRGLSFSEAQGARGTELLSMLTIYGFAVVCLIFRSPLTAAIGLGCVALLDAIAARRGEAPRYFTVFRPIQLAVGAAALIAVEVWTG